MKLRMLTTAVAAATALFAGAAQAVIIDTFEDPIVGSHEATAQGVGNSTAVNFGDGTSTSIIGGYRDLIAIVNADTTGVGTKRTTMEVAGGGLSFSNSSGTDGTGIVRWDGDADASTVSYSLGADLINQAGCPVLGCNQFISTVIEADLGFQYKIGVYTDATNYSILTAFTQEEITSPTTVNYLFDWFLLPENDITDPTDFYFLGGLAFTIESEGAVDFTNVGMLDFTINTGGKANVDLTLDSISKTGVPEPGALALVGVALLGAAAARRSRKA